MKSILLAPLAKIYGLISKLRNSLYEKGFIKSSEFATPIVSVGNITMGGTGKTPFIEHLIGWAKQNNIKVGVVSRGYGGENKDVAKVVLKSGSAQRFGDEPTMLANLHPDVPIYVCAQRTKAVSELLQASPVDMILADDAFQHRRLSRSLDIVLIDATEDLSNYEFIPLGRARESFHSLARAGVIVITKTNLVDEDKIFKIENKINEFIELSEKILIYGEYTTIGLSDMRSQSAHFTADESWLLVSGIAKPQAFKRIVRELGVNVKEHLVFPDHYKYKASDVDAIRSKAKDLLVDKVVFTEKDHLKIIDVSKDNHSFYYLRVNYKISGQVDEFYEKLNSFIR